MGLRGDILLGDALNLVKMLAHDPSGCWAVHYVYPSIVKRQNERERKRKQAEQYAAMLGRVQANSDEERAELEAQRAAAKEYLERLK